MARNADLNVNAVQAKVRIGLDENINGCGVFASLVLSVIQLKNGVR